MVMLEKMKVVEQQSLMEVALDEQQPLEAMIEAKKRIEYVQFYDLFLYTVDDVRDFGCD